MKKKRILYPLVSSLILVAVLLLESGCASIVHGGSREVIIRSEPPGANVLVLKQGTSEAVASGTTPITVSLDPKRGYFKGQSYVIKFDFPGYRSAEVLVQSTLSGWYFGNIIFGGLIGMLIVDPLTGSMWNLAPEEVDQSLHPESSQVIESGDGIVVARLSQLSESEKARLVRIN